MASISGNTYSGVVGTARLLIMLLCASTAAAESGLAPGYPEQVEAMDSREVAMLPRYCPYTQVFRDRVPGGNNAAEIHRWSNTIGPVFYAMHHYCVGLMKTNRALLIARTPQYKKFYLESSLEEFDYVIRHATSDFVLLPEILTKKGENLIRLGRASSAVLELLRAIELKPDYWPPYAVLSDHYKSTGNVDKAREVLEKGLSLSPDVKALKTRLAELRAVNDKRKAAQ